MNRFDPTTRSASGARIVRASVVLGLAASVGLQWSGGVEVAAPAAAPETPVDCGSAAISPPGAL